jgi:Flp pilus assembly protein TadG
LLTRRRIAQRSLGNRSGSALIEFALIAPILLTLLLGMYDLGPALLVRFKLASATQAVADIATQAPTMQASDVVNFFGAGGDVMAPFSSSTLNLRISNIASNGLGRAFVYWSCGQGTLPPFTATTTITSTPTGTPLTNLLVLLPGLSGLYVVSGINTSYIMVESQYTFTPPVGFVIKAAQTLTNTAYALPRVSTYVGPTTGSAGYVPTPPILIVGSFATSLNGITCNTGY